MTASELRDLDRFPLVEVVPFGRAEQNCAPGVGSDGSLVVDPGEVTIWQAPAWVWGLIALDGTTFRSVWQPNSIEVILTDRRIMYYQEKFDHGRSNASGLLNIALSTYSKRNAAQRQKGKVAAGHIRYENLLQLVMRNKPAGLVGTSFRTLSFDIAGSGPAVVRIEVRVDKTPLDFESQVARAASLAAGRDIPLLNGAQRTA